jgi:acetyl esterase
VLRDDGLRYAEALRAAGVDVTLERYDDMVHSFLRWGGVVERARDLVEALGEYTRAALR